MYPFGFPRSNFLKEVLVRVFSNVIRAAVALNATITNNMVPDMVAWNTYK